MKISFFVLMFVVFLIILTPMINNSFAEVKSIESWEKEITIKNIIPKNYTTKAIFENSLERYYNYTRAWNASMYNEFHATKVDDPRYVHNWWTGITLYRIGEIDPISGTYELDFNYWIQIFEDDDKTDLQDNESFKIDFVNSVGNEKEFFETSKGVKQKNHYYDTMVSGEFYSVMNFTKFPFETVNLKIIVEPDYNTAYDVLSSDVQFQRWPYPVLYAEGVPSPEYNIANYAISIEDHKYSEGDTYSRYVAEFELQRDTYSAFLKYILPIVVMVILATAALLFPSEEYMTKIELSAIFLLGILFFVQVVSAEIPSTGNLTIFDTVVIIGYIVITITMAIPAIKWHLRIKFETKEADYEEWKDQDRRFHDLHGDKQRRIEQRLTYLMGKIRLETDPAEITKIKNESELFEKLRIQVINFKNIEEDMTKVAATKDLELKDKIPLIDKLENKRKELNEKINLTRDEIKEQSEYYLVDYYHRDEFIKNKEIFKITKFFDPTNKEKELKIVSWGYAGDFKNLNKWNHILNIIGFGLVIGISIYGYKLVEFIYHG